MPSTSKVLNYGSLRLPTDSGPRTGLVTYGYVVDSDFFDWLHAYRASEFTPEQSLMLAILDYAQQEACWSGQPPYMNAAQRKHDYDRYHARAWIADGDDRWLFSFNSICAALSLAPAPTRRRIQALYARVPV